MNGYGAIGVVMIILIAFAIMDDGNFTKYGPRDLFYCFTAILAFGFLAGLSV